VATEKKTRALEKKLRQVAELKELQAGGKPLEANQLAKIAAEDTLRAELAALQVKSTEEAKQGMWR